MGAKFFKKVIGKNIADKMTKAYKKKYNKVDDGKGGKKDDTLSVWISKDNILQFFEGNNSAADGLRIYFGVAGNYKHSGETDVNCDPKYINQTNLVFVPTLSTETGAPTMTNSVNYIDKNNHATSLSSGLGDIEDEFDMCPPETASHKCPEII
jgi:hypothetical protein